MGNQASSTAKDGTNVSLDELGGFYRPAVLRKNELNTKTDWLGQAVLLQADKMERDMQLKSMRTRDQQMQALGGPTQQAKKKAGFGSLVTSSSEAVTPSPSGKAKLQASRSEPPGRPNAAMGPPLSPKRTGSTASTPLRPTTAGAGPSGLGLMAAGPSGMMLPSAGGSGLWPAASEVPVVASIKASTEFGPAARKLKAEALAAAKAAKTAEEHFKANHWRKRVEVAKKRLYYYLLAYMAFMSILKKKRVGYADPLPIDVLPVVLYNVLKEYTETVGEHLVSCGGLFYSEQQAKAKLSALGGGRMWLARARLGSNTEPGTQLDTDGNPIQSSASPPISPGTVPLRLPSALQSLSSPTHLQLPLIHTVIATPGNPARVSDLALSPALISSQQPETPSGSPGSKRRGGARALVAAGAGATALEKAGLSASYKPPAIDFLTTLSPSRTYAFRKTGCLSGTWLVISLAGCLASVLVTRTYHYSDES